MTASSSRWITIADYNKLVLLQNIGRIVEDNYSSLVHEAPGRGKKSQLVVFGIFGFFPATAGFLFGLASPFWTSIITALVSSIGVLTGFGINSIMLLTNAATEDMYEQKRNMVNQTLDYTLYSVLVGLLSLVVLLFGFILSEANIPFSMPTIPISRAQLISIVVYFALIHYFMVLFVITHRMYSLINTNAIGRGG